MRIRTVKTSSGKFAVQVVSKHKGRITIHKHVGSYDAESDWEKLRITSQAEDFIKAHDNIQNDLFDDNEIPFPNPQKNDLLSNPEIKIVSSQPLHLYRLLSRIYDHLGLNGYNDPLIKDLIIARVYKPVSKRETVEILRDLFDKNYSLKTVYRHLKTAIDKGLKDQFQIALINFARQDLNDSLRLVFYDVTTLAFDSQLRKGLKDFGFSKDHRFQDVQIVVGLVVNNQGFPLYFEVFNGKTFEGHTFVATVEKIKTLLANPDLVVIADAAMISKFNIEELNKRNISFIVGARLGNLPVKLREEISEKILGENLKTASVIYLSHRLICQYSSSRAAKDRSDREKQLIKAKMIISSPAKITGRFRFVETVGGGYQINEKLLEKVKRLEGIKGYLTNTGLDEQTIIDRYHDLWRIENSFRLTKSDLEARPIFLRLDQTITAHLVIVFAGLAICRYLEIKTGISTKKIIKIVQKVLTHKVIFPKTNSVQLIDTTIEDKNLREQFNKFNDLGH